MGSRIAPSLPDARSGKLSQSPTAMVARPGRRRILQVAVLVSVPILALASVLPGAWTEAARREAYLPQLEAEARQKPFDGRLLALLGGRLEECVEYPAAADALRRSLAAGEQPPLVWLNYAAASAASGDVARARADLDLALRANPRSSEFLAAQTRAGSLAPGASPLSLAQALCPDGPAPLIHHYSAGSFLNGAFERWGRLGPDASGFHTREQWAREAPRDPRVQWRWGLALLRNRRGQEAAATLTRCIALDPSFAPAHLGLAQALDAQRLSGDAALQYLQTLKLQPGCVPALEGAGANYLETGVVPIAIAFYARATALDPKNVEAWIGLGQAYRTTGVDHDKSVAAFETAARLAPTRTDFFDDYADALRQAVKWQAAEDVLRRRIKETTNDPLAHYMLGMVLLNSSPTPERQAAAEAETLQALRLYPHNPLADLQLAQIRLSSGRRGEAIDLLQDALRSDPHNRNAMTVLARAYRQSGRADLSARYSKQADMLYKDQERAQVLEGEESKHLMEPEFHENLGRLYARVGEPKKADYEQSMARLLRANPRQAADELRDLNATRTAALPAR